MILRLQKARSSLALKMLSSGQKMHNSEYLEYNTQLMHFVSIMEMQFNYPSKKKEAATTILARAIVCCARVEHATKCVSNVPGT